MLKVVYILYRNWTRVGHGFVNSIIQFMETMIKARKMVNLSRGKTVNCAKKALR
mgnify:CR=1 FL=1